MFRTCGWWMASLLLAATLAMPAQAQDARENAVEIELSILGTPRDGLPVRLMLAITNRSGSALTLPARPGWDERGGLEIRAIVHGRAMPLAKEPPSPRPIASRSAMVLQPGQSFAVMRSVPYAEITRHGVPLSLQAVYRRPGIVDTFSAATRFTSAGNR